MVHSTKPDTQEVASVTLTTEIKLIVRSNTAAIRQSAPVHTTFCS